MKHSKQIACKSLIFGICLISIGVQAQKQSKRYTEKFTVGDEAILDINTSYADLEFETWNKNQIVVEATVELENATNEEAQDYFANEGIEILGNSNKVSITTGTAQPFTNEYFENLGNLQIEIPELPEFETFEMDFDMAELSDMPPNPPTPDVNFDYEAFQKHGEAYLKEWQKNFQKEFGEPYQKSMEHWQEEMQGKQEELRVKREQLLEKRMEAHSEKMEHMAKARVEEAKKRAEANQKRIKFNATRKKQDSISRDLEGYQGAARANTFYFNSTDPNSRLKVKKTIKIKIPKNTKIQMNVRHGEVKMVGNTKNMNATLSHASLLASVIEGEKTKVTASYSPVSVQHWNYGALQVDYSEDIELQEVLNLQLSSTFSEVTIANLTTSAVVKNNFGPLIIESISDDFEKLEVSMQNAAFNCKLPKTAFDMSISSEQSELVSPEWLQLDTTSNHGSTVRKGFNGKRNSGRKIHILSKYSDVVLK